MANYLAPVDSSTPTAKAEITPESSNFTSTFTPSPIPKREFASLLAGPTVNVYAGKRPAHALVAPNFPAALLAAFSPALSTQLGGVKASNTHSVLLEDLAPSATAWILHLARTNHGGNPLASLATWPAGKLLERLHAALVLGHRSGASVGLSRAARAVALAGNMPEAAAAWVFSAAAPKAVHAFAQSLADPAVDAVLAGLLRQPLAGALDLPWWRDEARRCLQRRCPEILGRYFGRGRPLDHFQASFVWQFARDGDCARFCIAVGLLWAIRTRRGAAAHHLRTRRLFPGISAHMRAIEAGWRRQGWLDPAALSGPTDPVFDWCVSYAGAEAAKAAGTEAPNAQDKLAALASGGGADARAGPDQGKPGAAAAAGGALDVAKLTALICEVGYATAGTDDVAVVEVLAVAVPAGPGPKRRTQSLPSLPSR